MRPAWIYAFTLLATLSSTTASHAHRGTSQAERIATRAHHERQTRLPLKMDASTRRLVARDPHVLEFERARAAQKRSHTKAARKVEGMLRQRLRIAQLPASAKAEAGRLFAETKALGLTLHRGTTFFPREGGRTMKLVFVGPRTRYELALTAGAQGASPRLAVRRRTWSPNRNTETVFEGRNGAVVREDIASAVAANGMWSTTRTKAVLDGKSGAVIHEIQ